MKKITLLSATIVASMALLSGCNNAAPAANDAAQSDAPAAGSVVYFNLDKVLEDFDMANDLRAVAETKVNSINQEVNRRGAKLEKDIKAFQEKINKGLLTQSVAEAQNQKLQQQQASFQNYAAQKQQEIAEEQQVMMNQIADAINTFVTAYNEKMGYALILTTQGGILSAPVVCGQADLDITDAILEGLNAEYVANKGKAQAETE